MYIFSFFIYLLIKYISSEYTIIDSEIILNNGGDQVISIPIKNNDFSTLSITSNGFFIKFYSDSSRTLGEFKGTDFQFSGISSDGCQLSQDLAVLVDSGNKKIRIFKISNGEIITNLTLNDFDNDSISLSCSYGNDIFSITLSKSNIGKIFWYNSNSQLGYKEINSIIDNHISCSMFTSYKYTVCFYTNDTYRKNSYFTLYDENFNIKKEGNVNSINMEHQQSTNEQITENYGIISKRLDSDKIMYCELKNLAWYRFQFFCNVGLLNLSVNNQDNIFYLHSSQPDFAVLHSISSNINHCFIGIRSDSIFPTICRYNDSSTNQETILSSISFVTYSNKQFSFFYGEIDTGGTIIVNITSNLNTIINVLQFNDNGIGYLFSDGTNTKLSLYFPKCSSSLSDSLNKYLYTNSQCIPSNTHIDGYYYDSLYHKFIQISTGASNCNRDSLTLKLLCSCNSDNGYYNVPSDYVGDDKCWNKNDINNYYYFDSSSNSFIKCYTGCLICSSGSTCSKCDNPTTLSSTNNYYYPIPPTGTIEKCIDRNSNENGYYFISINKGFGECSNSCKTCSNTSTSPTTLCTECKETYYPKNTALSPNLECVTGTIEKWYYNNSLYMPCYETCKYCTITSMENTTNKCTECLTNYYPLADSSTNNVISPYDCRNTTTKPTNTILVDNEYKYCNKACLTCTAIGTDDIPYCTEEQCSYSYYPMENDYTKCINEDVKNNYYSHYYLYTSDRFSIYKECNESCLTCTGNPKTCINCAVGYKPLYPYSDTKRCFNDSTKSSMFYESNIDGVDVYNICYKNCDTCTKGGDDTDNNCTTCTTGYIENPDKVGQCEIKCEEGEYFYIETLNNYKYTCTNQCPINYPYLDEENSRCYSSCPSTKQYIYEKKCISSCPKGTTFDDSKNCINGENLCLKSSYKIDYSLMEVISETSSMISNYLSFYSEISTHVNLYYQTDSIYKIAIYKKESCLTELAPEIAIPDFSNCLSKIRKSHPEISQNSPLTILLLNIIKTSQTEYKIYNSENGEELSKEPCSGDKIIVTVNMENVENINITEAEYFANLGINVYNFSDPFFNDICFEYTAKNGKDVTLEDRKKNYYQNVSLCESNCELISVNLNSLEANCSCEVKTDFLNNVLDNAFTGEILEVLNDINYGSIKCYKNVFDFSHFKKNIGSYSMIIIFFSQLPFLIIYIKTGLLNVRVNLLDYIKMNPPLKGSNTIDSNRNLIDTESETGKINKNIKIKHPKLKDDNVIITSDFNRGKFQSESYDESNSIDNNNIYNTNLNDELNYMESPEKNIKPQNKLFQIALNDNIDEKSIESNSISKSNEINNSISSNNSSKKKDNSLSINSNESENKENKNLKYKYKSLNIRKIIKKKDNSNDKNNNDDEEEIDDDELNSMELYDALILDKRKFCQFYWQQLQEKQNIINTFFTEHQFESFPIKIIIFFFEIALFFALNAFFYSESYVSDRFYQKKMTFMFFFKNQIYRIVYASICAEIIKFIIEFFANSKKKIELLIKKEKSNDSFRIEVVKVLHSMKRNYLILLIINFLFIIFFWYFLSTFCNVYKNSQLDWLKGSIITFVVIELLPFLFCLFITCLRYLGLKCKMEGAYKLSQCLSD